MRPGRHTLTLVTAGARRIAAATAILTTLAAVGTGLVLTHGRSVEAIPEAAPATAGAGSVTSSALADREVGLSRDLDRRASARLLAGLPLQLAAVGRRWTTAALDLRLTPGKNAARTGEVPALRRVAVTGLEVGRFAQIIYNGRARWVTARYLAEKKPEPRPAALPAPAVTGLSGRPCAGTASVEHGLTARAIMVYRAVCHAFPQITSYGGWSAHGEHSSGRALDIMTSDVSLGTAIAEYLRAHAAQLHLYDVLWRQRIWTPVRASEGWRPMPDRGSATANHYDHVHVSVY